MTMCKMVSRRGARLCAPTIMVVLFILAIAFPVAAQTVTDDDVNAIAKKMYCPVCENIPLDVCPTQACADWRGEIRQQLENGSTEQQIIDSFVVRYGERVIGTPQDPFLRALSLLTPWLIGAVAALVALISFNRWRRNHSAYSFALSPSPGMPILSDDDYRKRLENDLKERR
jgi:cytochrome c-type biogenesis protein CcmH